MGHIIVMERITVIEMKYNEFQFRATLLVYSGKAAWHYFSVPEAVSSEIYRGFCDMHKGWRSLPVLVRIGVTIWRTSIFYEIRNSTYMLPVKGEVRVCEKLMVGSVYLVKMEVIA